MGRKCFICRVDSDKTNEISLHKLPTNPIVKRDWLHFLGVESVPHSTFLCNIHFHSSCFEPTNSSLKLDVGFKPRPKTLKNLAVPSLHRKFPNHSSKLPLSMSSEKSTLILPMSANLVLTSDNDNEFNNSSVGSNTREEDEKASFSAFRNMETQTIEQARSSRILIKKKLKRETIAVTNFGGVTLVNHATQTTKELKMCLCPINQSQCACQNRLRKRSQGIQVDVKSTTSKRGKYTKRKDSSVECKAR